MDNKYSDEYLEELAHKHRKGILTKEERAEFDAWYLNHDDTVFEHSGADAPEFVKSRIYSRILTDIENESQHSKPRTIRLFPRIAAVAAIICAIAGTSLFFYYNSTKTEQTIASVQDVLPGGNKAILTLANGTKISLTDAINGQVAVQSGVRINKTANGQLVYDVSGVSSNQNETIEYNTIEAPVGGQWQVVLPDQSKVWLNALSSITYPTRFSGNERRVKITGEAYFEVAHNKSMPFRVQSQGQMVEVLGTHFNIMAYSDEKLIKTTLLEGSVRISDHGKNELLKPGQQAQVNATNIKVTNDVDLEDVVAWKNGYFKFNESLESIMNKISRWYDVEVLYQGQIDKNMAFGGEISRSKKISSALKIMELTGNIHFKIEGRRVTVMQ